MGGKHRHHPKGVPFFYHSDYIRGIAGRCTKCNIERPIDEFVSYKGKELDHARVCKSCTNAKRREYLKAHPEVCLKQAARARAYRARVKKTPERLLKQRVANKEWLIYRGGAEWQEYYFKRTIKGGMQKVAKGVREQGIRHPSLMSVGRGGQRKSLSAEYLQRHLREHALYIYENWVENKLDPKVRPVLTYVGPGDKTLIESYRWDVVATRAERARECSRKRAETMKRSSNGKFAKQNNKLPIERRVQGDRWEDGGEDSFCAGHGYNQDNIRVPEGRRATSQGSGRQDTEHSRPAS